MQDCRISVIVPACNAAPYLDRCLGALLSQQDGLLEIILVDDSSKDTTVAVAESMNVTVVRLGSNGGPSRARNAGARKATGDVIMFIDADVALRPGMIARLRQFFERNPGVAAVFGSYDAEPSAKGAVTEYRNLLHHFTHQNGNRDASTFWSGCGAVRRSVFLEVGGFDENDYPRCIEDIELGYRLRQAGHSIVLDRDLLCTHMKRWTIPSMIKTDIFARAIPWTRLNLKRKVAPNDLNIKTAQKLCVLLTGFAVATVPLALLTPWVLIAGLLAIVGVVALNRGLFRFLWHRGGPVFAAKCVPLQLLYFFYSGLSFAYVQLFMTVGLPIHDGNTPSGKIFVPRKAATR